MYEDGHREHLLREFEKRAHVVRVEVDESEGKATVVVVSEMSKKESTVVVRLDGLLAWLDRKRIQVALPNLDDDERELLLSGYTAEDWDRIFDMSEEEF